MESKTLTAARKAFVAEERKKQGESDENTLDAAIITALRKQAESKGFTVE